MRKFYLVIVGLLVGILAFSGNCYAASYTVKPGDTLYKIAVNNGTTVDTLTSLNNLNSTMIYPGDVLQLPDSGQTPGSAQQYTVQPGDTLYLISKAYGTTVDAIMSQNNLSSTVIYPGQVLLIPGSGQAPPSSTAPTGATQQYTVQPGDTLYLISRAYCTTVDAIMSQNNLSSTVIYPGQVLQVPGNSSTTPSRGGRGSYSAEERYLLAQIISAEAAGEIFEGQVAVGAVILNRITDYRFPNNLWDVIYEPWQFEPVQNGTINLPPVSSAIRAADAALDGWDPVDGAVYFCNPDTAQSTDFFRTLTYVRRIGNHVFYR
jgi:LysM repeat protein